MNVILRTGLADSLAPFFGLTPCAVWDWFLSRCIISDPYGIRQMEGRLNRWGVSCVAMPIPGMGFSLQDRCSIKQHAMHSTFWLFIVFLKQEFPFPILTTPFSQHFCAFPTLHTWDCQAENKKPQFYTD